MQCTLNNFLSSITFPSHTHTHTPPPPCFKQCLEGFIMVSSCEHAANFHPLHLSVPFPCLRSSNSPCFTLRSYYYSLTLVTFSFSLLSFNVICQKKWKKIQIIFKKFFIVVLGLPCNIYNSSYNIS
jgi:hypothetical protein